MQGTTLQGAAIAFLAAACAATPSLPGKPGCFAPADVAEGRGVTWIVLNPRTLIIRRPEDTYLIEIAQPVFGLSFWRNVSFDDVEHSGKICGNASGRDWLVVPGYEPPRISITAVRELSPAEAASLLAEPKEVHGK